MFIQPDWFEVTEPGVGTNRYSYSFNDPVNLMDPGGNTVELDGDTDGDGVLSDEEKLALEKATVDYETLKADEILGPKIIELEKSKVQYVITVSPQVSNEINLNPNNSNTVTRLSDQKFKIEPGKMGHEAYDKSNGAADTTYDPYGMDGGVDDVGSKLRDPIVGLSHELGHAYDLNDGGFVIDRSKPGVPGSTPPHEKPSLEFENRTRSVTPRPYPRDFIGPTGFLNHAPRSEYHR